MTRRTNSLGKSWLSGLACGIFVCWATSAIANRYWKPVSPSEQFFKLASAYSEQREELCQGLLRILRNSQARDSDRIRSSRLLSDLEYCEALPDMFAAQDLFEPRQYKLRGDWAQPVSTHIIELGESGVVDFIDRVLRNEPMGQFKNIEISINHDDELSTTALIYLRGLGTFEEFENVRISELREFFEKRGRPWIKLQRRVDVTIGSDGELKSEQQVLEFITRDRVSGKKVWLLSSRDAKRLKPLYRYLVQYTHDGKLCIDDEKLIRHGELKAGRLELDLSAIDITREFQAVQVIRNAKELEDLAAKNTKRGKHKKGSGPKHKKGSGPIVFERLGIPDSESQATFAAIAALGTIHEKSTPPTRRANTSSVC